VLLLGLAAPMLGTLDPSAMDSGHINTLPGVAAHLPCWMDRA
jgi:hypothetical protein